MQKAQFIIGRFVLIQVIVDRQRTHTGRGTTHRDDRSVLLLFNRQICSSQTLLAFCVLLAKKINPTFFKVV
ncbi:Uncharacterised protein [Vibrio cholerae]|nr:Uncharacterised protein [Vibrio cholerae]